MGIRVRFRINESKINVLNVNRRNSETRNNMDIGEFERVYLPRNNADQ